MTEVTEALERHALACEAEDEQRARMQEDLRFAALDQWPSELKRTRENDINGSRPCLVLDLNGQYERQVENDTRSNLPSIRYRPVDSSADKRTAEVLNGLMRQVEDSSPASIAYLTGFISAVRIGLGYFRLQTDVVSDDSWDQALRITRIPNTFSVYRDPHSTEVDGSDMDWLFITEDVKRPKDKNISEWSAGGTGDLSAQWFGADTMRIAEYFCIKRKKDEVLLLGDNTTLYGSRYQEMLAEGRGLAPVTKRRPVQKRICMWQKISGAEVLEETEFPAGFIPVIPVEGSEFCIDGKRMLTGVIRAIRDGQRGFNYWASILTELIALAPRAPYIAAEGQIGEYKHQWEHANRANFSLLMYKPVSAGGTLVGPPQRQPFAGVPSGVMELLRMFQGSIQSAYGMYQASVGAPSNEKSGIAIRERKQEGEIGQLHYRFNLGLSMRHAGRIALEVFQRYDTARIERILGEDGAEDTVALDPQMPVAFQETPKGQPNLANITIGRYDVSVDPGPAYATRRQEAAKAMSETLQAAPQLVQTHGDLFFRSQDWPDADKWADRSKKTLPPELADEEESGQPQIPPEIRMQIEQAMAQKDEQIELAKQAIAELQQELAAASEKVKEGDMTLKDKSADIEFKGQDIGLKGRELELKAFEAETRRLEAETKVQEAQMRMQQALEQGAMEAEKDAAEAQALSALMQSQAELSCTVEGLAQMASAPKQIEIEAVRENGRIVGGIARVNGQEIRVSLAR